MAMQSLGMIILILAVLLVVGVPISYSIGIASLFTILQTVPLDISVVTGAQRIFVGMSKFSLTAIQCCRAVQETFLAPGRESVLAVKALSARQCKR